MKCISFFCFCCMAGAGVTAVSAQPFPGGPGDASCPDTFPSTGSFKLYKLDDLANPITLSFTSGTAVVGRSDPFAEGAEPGPPAGVAICSAGPSSAYPATALTVPDPCFPPMDWSEGPLTRREVHTEMLSLVMTAGGATLRAGQPYFDSVNGLPQSAFYRNSTGEVTSLDLAGTTALDFPARSFFEIYVEVETTAGVNLYNRRPMVVESKTPLTGFPPNLALPDSTYYHDPDFGAVLMYDGDGVPYGWLVSAGHGSGPPNEDAELLLQSPASFTVDDASVGLDPTVTLKPPNHVFDDNTLPDEQVTVYVSSGATRGSPPDVTNVRVPPLVGAPVPGSFAVGDAINSFSFGTDGTMDPVLMIPSPGVLFFSVPRAAVGGYCSAVYMTAVFGGPAGGIAADIYGSMVGAFGSYAEALTPPLASPGNTLIVDSTLLGLRPLLADTGDDNMTGMELRDFPDDPRGLWFGTFVGPSFPAPGDGGTIYHYDPSSGAFSLGNLVAYALPGTMGLGAGDVIDALILSDVFRDGELDPGADEVLFSLAPGSPTLAAFGLSAADVFYASFTGTFSLFATAAMLGLEPGDDVDALDIKPTPGPECGNNIREGAEQCDGTDDIACPGLCRVDCTCPNSSVPICGDNVVNLPGEVCDGTDDAACPGRCTPNCKCPDLIPCGDNTVNHPAETCDGTDDLTCSFPGTCRPPGAPNECTCCGDGIKQAAEVCDPQAPWPDNLCPNGMPCPLNCICGNCGDEFIDAGEECDGNSDGACPGECIPSGQPRECTCRYTGIPTVSEWGLLAMTLLVLAAGTSVLMRRRRAPA